MLQTARQSLYLNRSNRYYVVESHALVWYQPDGYVYKLRCKSLYCAINLCVACIFVAHRRDRFLFTRYRRYGALASA